MTAEVQPSRGLDADASDGSPRRSLLDGLARHLGVLATALATAPFVVAAVAMLARYRDFAPYADIALIELGTRDVGRHVVLLGVYSRFGWRHPGPFLFYLLAVPYWLSLGSSSGLLAGAALLNGACVVVVAWLAHRRGGRPLLFLTLLGLSLLSRTLGPELWTDPWNPSLALFPLVVVLFCCWGLADGDDVVLPILVVSATFCVQAHVGYAMLVAVPLAIAIVSRVLLSRHPIRPVESAEAGDPGRPGRLRRALVGSALVGALLWLPPLIDQIVHRPGNLQDLASFLRAAHPEYGLRDGLSFTQYELGIKPVWLFGEHQAGWLGLVDYSAPPLPIVAVLLLGVTALALWRRDWSGTRLAALAIGVIFASILAVSRVVEGLFPYVVRWSPAVGFLALVAIVWIGWRAVVDRLPGTVRRAVGAVVLVALVVASAANVWAGATTPPHDNDKSELVRSLTAQVAPKLDKSQPVAVETPDPTGGVEALFLLPAIALQLEREGYDVRVDDSRFTNRGNKRDVHQVVSIHHVEPAAPTVPELASIPPAAAQDDFLVWVTPR